MSKFKGQKGQASGNGHWREDEIRESKWMQFPREVLIGNDVLKETPAALKKLKLTGKTFIVTGKNTADVAGNGVADILEKNGNECFIYKSEKASLEEVERIVAAAKEFKPKCFLGVGSGRSIDLAKLASKRCDIPFISIPTAASHDGIASSRASIHSDEKSESYEAQAPIAVIADTGIISQAPFRLLSAGCGDVISNCTAVLDWELASRHQNEPFSESAALMSKMSAEMIMGSADLIRPGLDSSARMVVKALVLSGVAMSIAGSSRPASGSEHMFSHALDRIAKKPALHGEQCAIGAVMMMYLHGGDWEKIRNALIQIGVPTSASEMGIKDEEIVDALLLAHTIRPERYTILGTGLTPSAAEKVAAVTKVIQ
ncbi:NAD(P)-dependent glycerol-1-phosphate dehydrogenase [Methanolapillus millepedarum]|uniref:Glycerol-1-phosphate dehydrogenase [NAD(P)+] n=1 Tax=Methanolapillus millepedarum TaxID=3028296 RepID=A0AA96V238_9EURY|nr:Glycerol-1-phosphate dehydrogenase [NAD(P)+] [Methanosarcinaceae archaeon Ac7]